MSFLTERYFQILDGHKLYDHIVSKKSLKFFMERHIICVWSYNALLRSLQKDIVALSLPLNTESHKEAVRLISEIILNEEVEDLGDGSYLSHLELYLESMQSLECDLSNILSFFDILEGGVSPEKAFIYVAFSNEIKRYAEHTISVLKRPLHIRAAALFYEGEPFIPDHFLNVIERLSNQMNVDRLLDYLELHIEGLKCPGFSAAGRLVEVLCRADRSLNRESEVMAEKVMWERIVLWNSLLADIEKIESFPYLSPKPKMHLRLVT